MLNKLINPSFPNVLLYFYASRFKRGDPNAHVLMSKPNTWKYTEHLDSRSNPVVVRIRKWSGLCDELINLYKPRPYVTAGEGGPCSMPNATGGDGWMWVDNF